jgi:hypothetical protein
MAMTIRPVRTIVLIGLYETNTIGYVLPYTKPMAGAVVALPVSRGVCPAMGGLSIIGERCGGTAKRLPRPQHFFPGCRQTQEAQHQRDLGLPGAGAYHPWRRVVALVEHTRRARTEPIRPERAGGESPGVRWHNKRGST